MEHKPEPYPDNMKTYLILSTHASLTEAVAAAEIDLSYNEEHARRHIRDIETGWNGRSERPAAVFILEIEGKKEVWYINRNDGLRMIHKFSPFISVMDNGPLVLWVHNEETGMITRTDVERPNNTQGRSLFRVDCQTMKCVCVGK